MNDTIEEVGRRLKGRRWRAYRVFVDEPRVIVGRRCAHKLTITRPAELGAFFSFTRPTTHRYHRQPPPMATGRIGSPPLPISLLAWPPNAHHTSNGLHAPPLNISCSTLGPGHTSRVTALTDVDHVALYREPISTIHVFSCPSSNLSVFITIPPSLMPSTRRKNKSTHPGIPDMTLSQLTSAGLSCAPAPRRKKLTKDQQIAALQDELRSIRELIANVTFHPICIPHNAY